MAPEWGRASCIAKFETVVLVLKHRNVGGDVFDANKEWVVGTGIKFRGR